MTSYTEKVKGVQKGFELEAVRKINKIQNYDKNKGEYVINENGKMIGFSPAMIAVFYLINHAANSDSTVLLLGETGTGKELVARAIHHYRNDKNNFIPVNCTVLDEQQIASELFGYVKGAFTGADPKGRKGAFELANNGTILLD